MSQAWQLTAVTTRGLVAQAARPEKKRPALTEAQTELAFCPDELFLLTHLPVGSLVPFVDIGPWYRAP